MIQAFLFISAGFAAAAVAPRTQATAFYHRGKIREAAAVLERAIKKNPEDVALYLDAAVIYRDLEKHRRAQELFEEAESLKPADPAISAAVGWAAMRAGNRNTARSAFYRAIKNQMDHGEALLGLARLNLDMGRAKSALNTLERLREHHPQYTIGHILRGQAMEKLDSPKDAIQAYKSAFRSEPTFSEARLYSAPLHKKLRQWNEAWRSYTQVLNVDPRHRQSRKEAARLRKKITRKPSQLLPQRKQKEHRPVIRAGGDPKMPVIKVAIGTSPSGKPAAKKSIAFLPSGPFEIVDPETGKLLDAGPGGKAWRVTTLRRGKTFEIHDDTGKRRVGFQRVVALRPKDSSKDSIIFQRLELDKGTDWATQGDRQLKGTIEIRGRGWRGVYLVNHVPLEDYVYGVINEEMPAKFDMEALKAQAVIARNHALIEKNVVRKHRRMPYDLCDGQHCQVYSGITGETSRGHEAVNATRGKVLRYRGRLAQTPYSSNCGGHTQNGGEVKNWANVPYLTGRKDVAGSPIERKSPWEFDRWLKTSPKVFCNVKGYLHPSQFRWQRVIRASDLGDRIRLRNSKFGYLRGITILKRSKSGNVNKVLFKGTRGRYVVERETRIRGIFGLSSIRNTMFLIEAERNSKNIPHEYYIYGGGWGHNVGLCQYGALGRALAKQTYEQILTHYYKGTRIGSLGY